VLRQPPGMAFGDLGGNPWRSWQILGGVAGMCVQKISESLGIRWRFIPKISIHLVEKHNFRSPSHIPLLLLA
jgi:hypothetical protein